MKRKIIPINLCLFDGEGGGAAVGTGTGDVVGTGGENQVPSAAGKGRRAVNPLANVKYGRQETVTQDTLPGGQQDAAADGNTQTKTTSDTLEARRAEFERLITGEYRDLYDERVQGIVKNRIKEAKNLEQAVNRTQPLIEMLAAKYGITDPNNIEAITKAMDDDNAFYEEAAADAGLTVEQYKYMQKLERENRMMKEARVNAERQRQADQVYAGWLQEAERVKAAYPGFDLKKELENPSFGKMLGAGVGVMAAYQALHHDEIMTGAMQYTAQTIAKKTADGIASRKARPTENGLSTQASANVKSDVSKLTRADRAEIARRAARGEIISF